MIKSNFQLVFSVGVLHTYYESNSCGCLKFTEDEATSSLLKKLGFKKQLTKNGFNLYADTAQAMTDLLEYMQKVSGCNELVYKIVLSDPKFLLFTELPVDQGLYLTYDTGYEGNVYKADVLELPAVASYENAGVFGSLKIALKDLIKYHNGNGPLRMQLNYTARATQWQYYIINKSGVQLDGPAISNKSGITFSGPETTVMATGDQALLFSSGENLLPLSEHPVYKFDLVNRPGSNGSSAKKSAAPKVIYKGLPDPDPMRFNYTFIDGQKNISSPMYVYI